MKADRELVDKRRHTAYLPPCLMGRRKKEWEGINKQTKIKNDLVRGWSRAGWGAGLERTRARSPQTNM